MLSSNYVLADFVAEIPIMRANLAKMTTSLKLVEDGVTIQRSAARGHRVIHSLGFGIGHNGWHSVKETTRC